MRFFKTLLLCVFVLFLACSGCKKTTTGSLTIQLKARFNGQNVAFDSTRFADKNNRMLQFSELKFYLSHITLISNNNATQEVSLVQLIDFSNSNSLTLNFNNLKGDYKAVQFDCGLDSVLNNSNPSALDASNPTNPLAAGNAGDLYWSMQKYIFQQLGGKWDNNSDTLTMLNHGFFYSISTNANFRPGTRVAKNFSVCCHTPENLVLYIDLEKIFYGAQTIDIPSESSTISLSTDNPVIAPAFAGNFSKAFTF